MLKKILKGVVFLIPFFLGTFGFLSAGESVWDAMFNCILMYTLNFDNPAPNLLAELARWTAPLVTAGAIAQLIAGLRSWARNLLIRFRKDSTAVYGPESDKELIEAECGGRIVRTRGWEDFQKAQRYVLLGSDAENTAFLNRNSGALKDREVYLQSTSWRPQMIEEKRLHVFSVEENAARLFWKQSGLCRDYAERAQDGRYAIVLIGFGRLGEELLYWGLQFNLFDPKQKISYHVFPEGDDKGLKDFLELRPALSRLTDEVKPHDENWRGQAELLRSAQRVIVCDQQNTERTVQDLLFLAPQTAVDVLSGEDVFYRSLAPDSIQGSGQTAGQGQKKYNIRLFPWRREALHAAYIFNDGLLAAAKAINLRYEHIYSGIDETPENAQACWEKLDAFTRYSNISSADYHEITRQMLYFREGMTPYGRSPEEALAIFEKADEDTKMLFAELEHMRWCSYHYLNNWDYAPIKKKDRVRRLHPLLVPFAELPAGEPEKDAENVDRLFRVAAGREEKGK